MAEQSGSEKGWKCPNSSCSQQFPAGMAGMTYCPKCKTDVPVKTKRGVTLQSPESGALPSSRGPSSDSIGRAGTEGRPAGIDAQSAQGNAAVPLAAAAPHTPPAALPPGQGTTAAVSPNALKTQLHEPQKTEGHKNPVEETGTLNKNDDKDATDVTDKNRGEQEESDKVTKHQKKEIAKQKREEERKVELQRRQQEKTKTEQKKAEGRKKQLEQRQGASVNLQPTPTAAVEDSLRSQTGTNEDEYKSDSSDSGGGGGGAQGDESGSDKSVTNRGGKGRRRGRGGDEERGRGGGRGKGGGAGRGQGAGRGGGGGGRGGGDSGGGGGVDSRASETSGTTGVSSL